MTVAAVGGAVGSGGWVVAGGRVVWGGAEDSGVEEGDSVRLVSDSEGREPGSFTGRVGPVDEEATEVVTGSELSVSWEEQADRRSRHAAEEIRARDFLDILKSS